MRLRYLCTGCWMEDDGGSLYATCAGCSRAATQPVTKLLVDFIRNVGERVEEIFRCPEHKDPLALSCPKCGAVVDGRMVGNANWRVIALSGVPEAGKTSLLWSTRMALDQSALNLSPIGDSDTRIEALIDEIYREQGRQNHTLPTDANAKERNFAWEIVELDAKNQPKEPPRLLAIHDVSGEMWEKLANGDPPPEALRRYFDLVGGVMLVLDGAVLRDVLSSDSLGETGTTLRANPEVRRELAILDVLVRHLNDPSNTVSLGIVISKADLVWSVDSSWRPLKDTDPTAVPDNEVEEIVRRLLSATGRRELLFRPVNRFRNVRLFAVSALGFDPTEGFDRNLVSPSRVVEPLRWLFDEVS